jgi:ribosomal-protein-alanine N-acetyltransferase
MRRLMSLNLGQAAEVAGVSLRVVGAGTDARIAVDAPPDVPVREDGPRLPVRFRWMCPPDLGEVAAIERAGHARPWSEDEIDLARRGRNRVSLVAVSDRRVVGFLIYELREHGLQVLDLAVRPESRRQGVGSQMVARLIGRLDDPAEGRGRSRIDLVVREGNLTAQLFFRARGFRALAVVRGLDVDTGEDGYVLRYQLDGPLASAPQGKESA